MTHSPLTSLASATLLFGVLGPLRVLQNGRDSAPTGTLQRRLLSALILHADQILSADALCDVLWPNTLPGNHLAALHTHMFRLRRAVPDGVISRVAAGYRLDLDGASLDSRVFVDTVAAATATRVDDPAGSLAQLDAVLALWRGRPYDELGDVDAAIIEAQRLTEMRVRAMEERFDCMMHLGRHDEALADIEAFATAHPLLERPQAQLMVALQRSGRIADALMVFERYRRALGEELGVDPSPMIRDVHDGVVAGAPPRAAAHARPAVGVARYASSFVGRERLVDTLATMLDEHRLVTLLGTGGAGKTRLAHEVCHRRAADYPDGVWFCTLAIADPASVATTVAMTLDVEQRAGSDPLARIADVLRHQRALLVLDNCEHVLDEAARLAETVLALAPSIHVLATSRERLSIDGEQLCPVPPLPSPQVADVDEPAVQLFVDRAAAVRRGWRPSATELESIATICRRLDGLPLAIELAAARLHTLTLGEIEAGLNNRLAILTGGRRTSQRHRSLVAAIEWSYGMLGTDEQAVLDAVAMFQGPFTLDGAAALAGCDNERAGVILSSLVERSMLQRDGLRYVMLESLREYGEMQLTRRGELDRVRDAHADFHVDFVADANRRLREPRVEGVLDDIDESLADMRVAFGRLLERTDIDAALELVVGLHGYGLYRMRPEALAWGHAAAVAAIDAGIDSPRIAEALAVAGVAAWKRGDMAGADALVNDAFELENGGTSFLVLDGYANQALVHGDLQRAVDFASRALETDDARVDPLRTFEAKGMVLLAQGYLGDPAATLLADQLAAEVTGDTPHLAAAWLGYVTGEAMLETDPQLAKRRLAAALDRARACGATFVLGVAGTSYASLEARHGDPLAAIVEYRWVLAHWRRAGIRSLQWTTLRSVTELLTRIGDDWSAAVLLGSVTSSTTGHELFGVDARRLAVVAEVLEGRLGAESFAAALAQGAGLDDNDAAAVALDAFDRIQHAVE